MNQKLNHHKIHDAEAENHPPNKRMGSDKWPIGKGQGGDDEEEDRDPEQAGADVGTWINIIISKTDTSISTVMAIQLPGE